MGISSLGVGSSILTQDVVDQLREVDEQAQINPITLNIANANDKQDALNVVDASMDNLIDSINEMKTHSLFTERATEVSGTAVEVLALVNTDVQDFTLTVTSLATKQIQESGVFSSESDLIANKGEVTEVEEKDADGNPVLDEEGNPVMKEVETPSSLTVTISGTDFEIEYDSTTTLKDLKKSINDIAGEKLDVTIAQINDGEFTLFLSSVETGKEQEITIKDNSGNLKDDRLISLSELQAGTNAEFKFNGKEVERETNNVKDLVTGLSITLKEVGTSVVSVTQNRGEILDRLDSFVEKYNSAMRELDKVTKSSVETKEKGIFSTESTIKSMKNVVADLLSNTSSSGNLLNFGFDIDKDGFMSVDKVLFEQQLDENPRNVEAALAGGSFINSDGSSQEKKGAFSAMSDIIESYTKYGATLDSFQDSVSMNIKSLEEEKISLTESLDSKYEIMKKRFIAYDAMISRFNSTSTMFKEMAEAQLAASK
ncbi:MAG: flagellar filament capping protein FliD [Campylobacterota bacterium]|nr:flagellar filament capping protein FliD [Campylobacterota bacterium]